MDRHDLPGDLENLTEQQISDMGYPWAATLLNYGLGISASSHIEHMAKRWHRIARTYLDQPNDFNLVRYEDFKQDKLGTIDTLAKNLDFTPKNDIQSILDKPFQKPGKPTSDYQTYFGDQNYSTIVDICQSEMNALGYSA